MLKLLLLLLPLTSVAAPTAATAVAFAHLGGEAQIDVAFRDAMADDEASRRTVILQGPRDGGGFRFDAACGRAGTGCECLFYRRSTDTEPLRGTGTGVSSANNSLFCRIPGDQATPELVRYVSLRLRGGESLSGLVALRTALTLEDVLGPLDKIHVRGIFRNTCARTFFEGEGVSQNGVSCVPGQHLGVISASYSFYTYRSALDGNQPGGDTAFPTDICKRNGFLKIQCTGNAPELRYGFYDSAAGPFVVGVSLTRAPEGENLTSNYGFAALPDENGRCPLGLVKARPWVAQPRSMAPDGPSCPADGCPSNFLNTNSALNDTRLEELQPRPFSVLRQPNAVACDSSGDCTGAEFGGVSQAQSVPYTPLTPVLCVIPNHLLAGIF